MSDESTGEFNIYEAAEEVIAEGDPETDATDDSSSSDGQADGLQEKTEEVKELSPEEILKQVADQKESPEQFAEVLKLVNQLGAIGNGVPINVESPEQLKKLLEMGAGFYGKTEEHANLVKAKEAEFLQKETHLKEYESGLAQKEQEVEEVKYTQQILSSLFTKLQANDPELYAHLDSLYSGEENVFKSNASTHKKFEGEIKQLKDQIQNIHGEKKQQELGQIKQGWQKELTEVQTKHAAPLSKLGVKVDWKKVEDAWQADASNTISVEQALYAVHGKDIVAANESHKKLLETKNKTQSKLLHRSVVGSGAKGGEETIKASPGDYSSILAEASINM